MNDDGLLVWIVMHTLTSTLILLLLHGEKEIRVHRLAH